jgi:DNA-binding SARP family transcriptional activator/ABC-type branched-subunit amino acid transport system substrate-binding protein/DNA-binding beta-propeller fold protein YncE
VTTVRFRVLGVLQVEVDGVAAELGGARQRAVLAVLLMHANEPVATDRLVNESWGETAPATATKTAQVYVSRLRGALGNETLTTTPGGYLLRVPHGALDTDELEGLRARAREADPREASRLLRQGLALWRGPPYADLRYEAALQTEITRLEELRLTTLEERIEADLAGGGASQLVSELEALVREHPHRERLRGFLMLALYRSGRQAEALETYRQGRQLLDSELGLEPGPELKELERAILAHDPALDGPQRALRRTARRRSGALLAAGGALLLAAALTAVVLVRDPRAEATSGGGRAEALDTRTGKLLASVPLGTTPSSIAVGAGSVWVLDADDKTISAIDQDTRSRKGAPFSTTSTPTDIAAGAGALWIGNAFRKLPFSATSYPASVSRLDPDSRVVVATIALPRPKVVRYNVAGVDSLEHIAVTSDAVWVVGADLGVYRIDPRTNKRVGGRLKGVTGRRVEATSIAAGGGGVWVIEFGDAAVAKIDPRTNTIEPKIEVAAQGLSSLAVGARDLWASDPFGGLVWRIDPGRNLQRTIPVDLGVSWVTVGAGAVWATNELAGLVYRIDPSTNKADVVRRTDGPATVAVGAGAAWVSAAGPPSSGTALPTSVCSQVASRGEANPRFLIVSDFPLKGSDIAATHQMVEAIRLVLERHGYRAGAYTIGYQSCDDSTAQGGGYDLIRCYWNAKAYARNPAVIGIVGSYNSGCSGEEIPVANQAPNGPLAMISPASTVTDLTRLVRGVNTPADLQHLYPTGERNFVRTAAAGHLTSAAMAQFAKQKGVKRLFLSWDGNYYWGAYAADVGRAAKSLGIQIVGSAPFDPEARNYDQLARRIASTRADGVVLAAYLLPSTPALLRDLRAGVGPGVTLIGGEDFQPTLALAGPAALGVYWAYPGAEISLLPSAGRRFLKDLKARTGKPSQFYTASAAQSAEILLDAIARSDGTRASVTRELFKTRVENGILGDIRFDKNGDPVEAPITIWRIVRPSRAPNGYVPDRVIIGRAALLR